MKSTLFSLVVLALLLPSCNTIAGVGSDIRASGNALESAAQKSGRAIDNSMKPRSQSSTQTSSSQDTKPSKAPRQPEC